MHKTLMMDGAMTDESLELIKGTLDVLVLKTLSRGPLHGYAISRWIRETTLDAFTVEEGALYPALRRLEKKGLVEADWGVTETGREARIYRLTAQGKGELDASVKRWRRYVEAMGRVLGAPASG